MPESEFVEAIKAEIKKSLEGTPIAVREHVAHDMAVMMADILADWTPAEALLLAGTLQACATASVEASAADIAASN